MPRDNLAELMRQAGIAPPAWQGVTDIPRPRPMPRQMRSARQRAEDPRLSIESRLRARAEASPETDIDFVRAIREGVQSAPITRDEYIDQLRDMSRGGPVPDQVRNFPGDITGVNSMVAGARAFAQGDVQGGIINSGLGAITGLTFGAGTSRLRPRPPRAVFPNAPQTRFPSPPPRDIGRASDGSVLPVAERQPFRNSLRGGSADLMDATEASGQGEFRTMMGIDPTRRPHGLRSANTTPAQAGNEAETLGDFLAALPTKLERLTAEEYAAIAARHPWFRHATTGAPNPARIDLVRLSNARAPDGRFLHSEDAITNFTNPTAGSKIATSLRSQAQAAGVPIFSRHAGARGATGAPGGERLVAVIRLMERAERNGEYLAPADIAARLGAPGNQVNVLLSQIRNSSNRTRNIPPEVLTRFRALDAAQQARRNTERKRKVDGTLGWLATGGAWTTAGGLTASNDAQARERP